MRSQRDSLYGYSEHVLIIDGDQSVLDATSRRLQAEGYRVSVSNLDWGIELTISVLRPDVVLLDPLMSDLVSDELPALLRSHPASSSVPIILHSVVPVTALRNAVDIRGALGLIRKTDDSLEFTFAFNGLLDLRPEPTSTQMPKAPRRATSGTHCIELPDDEASVAVELASALNRPGR